MIKAKNKLVKIKNNEFKIVKIILIYLFVIYLNFIKKIFLFNCVLQRINQYN